MQKIPHHCDDAVMALNETWLRFEAYCRAVADAGPEPDEEMFFILAEMQFAMERWRDRFVAALERRGIPLDYVLGEAP